MCSVMTYISLPYLDPHCSMRRYGSVEAMKSDGGTFEVGHGGGALTTFKSNIVTRFGTIY